MKKQPKIKIECFFCKKIIEVTKSLKNKKFCSKQCSSRAKTKPRIEKKCENCSKTFVIIDDNKIYKKRFCSISCGQTGSRNTMCKSNSLEKWIKKYGEEEARKMWKERNKSISEKHKGKRFSDEHKKNLSKAKKGIPIPRNIVEKMNEGRRRTLEKNPKKYGSAVSNSEKQFFKRIEEIYNIKIQKQLYLEGRRFDGRWKNYILEPGGRYWHTNNPLDKIKEKIAEKNGFTLIRFEVNNVGEVEKRLMEYKPILDTIFLSH